MDEKNQETNNKISVWLGILALLFLASAVSLLIFQRDMGAHSEEKLNEMRANVPSTESGTENSVSTDDLSATNENADADDTVEPNEADGTGDASEETAESAAADTVAQNPPVELTDNPYRESFLSNEDMGAWLKIDGTVIDYPVMWTPRDETYYIERNFERKPDKNGCLLLDTDSCLNPLTTNLIIHGHNMRSGAMFGTLQKYSDESYCREHSQIVLYAEDREHRYEVIAAFRSQVYRKTDQVFKFYKFFQADTQEEFDDFYQNIKALSLYDTGVTAEFGDHFLTLSTCAYHVENGRFVVVAKEIGGGAQYRSFREDQGD